MVNDPFELRAQQQNVAGRTLNDLALRTANLLAEVCRKSGELIQPLGQSLPRISTRAERNRAKG
jgi:hypothetical protein